MNKKLIKQNIRCYLKVFLFICAMLAFICSFGFSTFAYSVDSDGNLVSDNLINASNREGRYWGTTQSDISATINDLDLGTYSISCDLTPISIDNNHNVGDCYFILQLVGGQYADAGQIIVISGFKSLNETKRGSLTFTKESYNNYEFRLWGFGNADFGGNQGIGRASNIMLNVGSSALPYEPYGAVYYSKENYNNALLDNYGIFRLCSSIKLTLTWTDKQQVDTYEWNSILSLINDKNYVNCINGVFNYSNQALSTDYLKGTYSATAMWQFNFNGVYPLVKQYPYMLGSGYVSRYQIIDNNGSLFAYDSFPNDSSYVDLTQYQNKQIGYIQLYTGPVGAGSSVDTTSLYFDNSYNVAYTRGYEDGKHNGYEDGRDYGEMIGYENGKNDGYDLGYNKGVEDGESSNFATNGFKTLIGSIFNYPINMIRNVFNFEFMGINIAALITFIISIVIVIFIVHKFKK